MKLPYDAANAEDKHNILLMKSLFPELGLVLDLQMQDGVYSSLGTGVEHRRVRHESKKVPSEETVRGFIAAAREWWDVAGHERSLIAVHCHYGFNRTGFLLVSYLVEEEGWNVERAIAGFAECRPPVRTLPAPT
jgi:protein-tyrosine phosphatase